MTDPRKLSPSRVDNHWIPLTQNWRLAEIEPGIEQGWARVDWDAKYLRYEAILEGHTPRNRARMINERTWELGDVIEIFLHAWGSPFYIELHVTPENQRLQLRWPLASHTDVANGTARLEDFMITDVGWARTATYVASKYWVAQVTLPVESLYPKAASLYPDTHLRTAVCRYDYSTRRGPMLSSTAPFRAPEFHRRQDWQRLVLSSVKTR